MGTANIGRMSAESLPPQLENILSDSFYIRTTLIRKNGNPETFEKTYLWV